MTDVNETRTSSTLLRRVKDPGDREAWEEFVDRYAPQIYSWCIWHGLQTTDAEDVTQNVLWKLYLTMRKFEYDRASSFRGYLRTATSNALKDHFAANAGKLVTGGTAVDVALNNAPARDDLLARLDEKFAMEVLEEARFRVRQRVSPESWEIFERLSAGEDGNSVAVAMGKSVDSIYKAKSRTEAFMREEVERLGRSL